MPSLKTCLLAAVWLGSAATSAAAQDVFRVMAVLPAPQTLQADTAAEIVVDFSLAVDAASLQGRAFSVFGRWTGVMPGAMHFEEDSTRLRFMPAHAFSAGEWITVALSRDVRAASGQTLGRGYAWNYWTRSGKGSLSLVQARLIDVREPGEPGIRSYGAYAGDLNGDGYQDLTIPNEDGGDIRVFLNDGVGGYGSRFERYLVPLGAKPSTNEGADFDGDGQIDFAVGNIIDGSVSVFRGTGKGKFFPAQTYGTGGGTRGLGVVDLDGDGAVDIVTANRTASSLSLLRNKGDGAFESAIAVEAGGDQETSIAIADANEDGLLDVFVGHFLSQEISVLLSDGAGGLSLASKVETGTAWMIAAGDVTNDGHVDVVAANSSFDNFSVLAGDGAGGLAAPINFKTGVFPIAIDLGDVDGDGDLDVVVSDFTEADWQLFENNGSGDFKPPLKFPAPRAGSCAVLHDRDRDGDLDLTGIDELQDQIVLFANPGAATPVPASAPAPSGGPEDFSLTASYPNPFFRQQPAVGLTISLAVRVRRRVQLHLLVFDITGRVVADRPLGDWPPGEWIVPISVAKFPSGLYFYRIRSAGGAAATGKFIVY